MDVRIVDAEAIRLAPGDVLIVKLNMGDPEACEEIARALGRLGLVDRALVLDVPGAEFAVVPADDDAGGSGYVPESNPDPDA